MKKSIFYYLFAVVCTVCLFTACSDDDDDKVTPTIDNIIGTYNGDIDVKLAGTEIVSNKSAAITVTKASESQVTVALNGFTIPGILEEAINISASCAVTPDGDDLKLTGSTTASILGMDLQVTITGEADGRELDLDITVPQAAVVVDFDGVK